MSVRPAKTQISLGICPVWSESSPSAWRKLGSLATHWAHSEDSDQTGRMTRLIWVFAGRTAALLVLSCRGSYAKFITHLDYNTYIIFSKKIASFKFHFVYTKQNKLRSRGAHAQNQSACTSASLISVKTLMFLAIAMKPAWFHITLTKPSFEKIQTRLKWSCSICHCIFYEEILFSHSLFRSIDLKNQLFSIKYNLSLSVQLTLSECLHQNRYVQMGLVSIENINNTSI